MMQHALITGAAGGIGRALVQVFREAGYHVIATDIIPQPVDLNCNFYIQADLSRFTEDETYATEILANIRVSLDENRLDVLVNNAAIQILGDSHFLTRRDWNETLNVNLLAPFLLTQGLLQQLEAATGSVVNIGSIHARLTKKKFVAYATSKAALAGLTRSLAVDLGPHIRLNAIEPAAIETSMLRSGFEANPHLYRHLETCHPLQRIGHPEEIAQLALEIVRGRLNFMHGACIAMDGGISCRLFDPD